jgi:hypothetical protein
VVNGRKEKGIKSKQIVIERLKFGRELLRAY